ncbi:MAG: leucine-rich repeat protein, partial [Clostridia bacterium]|nr:leucine-rich repeat protein [Clostridia bacterium]
MNKTLKKTLSIMLALFMVVTSVPFVFAADVSLVINMTDSYGDGWNGNAIQVGTISGGEFTKITDVTIDEGATATYEAAISDENVYAFRWTKGSYTEECSFSIVIGGKTVLEASDCNAYVPDGIFYITCNHSFSDSICSICELECGVDFAHTMNSDSECTACGFICSHSYTNHYCKTCKIAENGYYAGACGAENMNDAIWSLDSQGTLTISGTGKYDVEYLNAPWLAYESSIKDVVIEEGITNIRQGSFYELSNAVSLSIPSTVNEIEAYGNNYFAEFKLAEGDSNYALIDGVLFNADKTELVMYPVRKADETYTVPAGVLILGNDSFSSSENLKTINISDDVTTMNESCFFNSSVETVNIGKNVNFIDYNAFCNSDIKNIVLPEKLTEMSSSMFYNCSYLENLVIGSHVISINNNVINYCDALEAVHFTGTEAQWEAITKPENETDRINTIPVHFGALEEKTDRDATCGADGHTAGLYCAECDAYLTGEVIPATGEHESYTDGVCDVCDYECTHESYTDSKCDACGYECIHESYTDGVCDVCDYECPHEGYTNSICDVCGYECTHESYTDSKCDACGYECHHEGQKGSCEVCGANLGKLVIDVTDESTVEIGKGYPYYDEDGYIITGTNPDAMVYVREETDLTLSNLTTASLVFQYAPDNSVIHITLDGTTEVEYVDVFKSHLIFDGGETDTLKTSSFNTAGQPGSVTVNGGNIILDCVTETSLPTIICAGGFIINGGTVTASNNYYYVVFAPVTLNGGELNMISTSTAYQAILGSVIIEKGALLTVSATKGILDMSADIVMADDAEENDYFFVRYDTESEFAPVSDMKAALDGKTYAEIKIDTHEHSFENGKCVCGYECPHEWQNGKCDVCGYECPHEWQNGSCQVCGANLDKLVIDVTDELTVSIGKGYPYYDEDGYIITGTNPDAMVYVYEACDLTFNNVTVSGLDIVAGDNAVINIAFEGTNEIAGRVALYKEHLVFEGSDDATFKAARFYNGGNRDSSVTVNGGNMVLETVGRSAYTINCGNFIINDGTVTASNDSYEVIASSVKLNGGTLNVISTSGEHEAICDEITIDKGALLTVSGAYKLIDKDNGDIVKADGLTESDCFFVRYDTESEFTPVSDMKAALDGKTYAEIKIDTHEHSMDIIGKCICGFECTHESITDNKCDGCGSEGTIVTIEMIDGYGDGWNGNAVVIKHLVDGVYTEEGTATIEYGENGILTVLLPKDSIYTFSWVAGEYSEECNFTVVVDGETVYSCVDGSTLTDGQVIYSTCQHDWSNKDGICAKGCGYSCPHDNVTDGKCGVCGYECPHFDDVEKHFCTECGITVSKCADENGDSICDICNALMGAPGISVGGIYVDGSNYTDILGDADEGATAYYILETNTLVLDGFNYEGEDCGIICNGSLNIEVKGENKIVAVDGLCIYAEDDAVLNIGGTGKLDIEAIENGIYAASANDTDENIEINVKDSVTLNIDSADDGMDIDGRKANKITVSENGSLNIMAVSEGITVSEVSESVEILVKDNGTLTVDGKDECIYIVDADKATVTFTDHAKVSLVNNDEEGIYIDALENETVTVSGNADVYIDVVEQSVEADTVIIDGGSLKAYSKKTYDAIVATDVTVHAGKLIVSSEDDYAIKADSIKITGGTLVAGNNTAEYPVFSVAPDFSEYNSAYMVLASENADAAYLVEYDSANAENYRVITIQCKHELDGKVCKKCGFECGVDCGHYLEEGAVCAICGSIVYAITHQPTEAEPYVGLLDDTDASYQWYTVEENTSEITDENAATVSYTWGESSYDKETGWTGVPYEEDYSGQDFFTVAMKAGETVTVEVTGDFFSGVGLYDYDSDTEVWKDAQEGVTTYEFTVEAEGNYTFYTYVNSGVVTVKAHKITVDENAIDGETAAELKNPVIGKIHFCEVTFADGTTEISDAFEVTHLHSFTKYEVTEEAECGKAGKEVASCDHGCGATDENEIPALTHEPLAAVVENEVAAACEKAGSYDLVVYCDLCGEELDRDTVTVDALKHSFTKYEVTEEAECGKAGKEVA